MPRWSVDFDAGRDGVIGTGFQKLRRGNMRASRPQVRSISGFALLESLGGQHVQAFVFVRPEDHEYGVAVLWRHAPKFNRLPSDQLNAIDLRLIAKQRFEAGRDLDPREIGQRKPLRNKWILSFFQFWFVSHVDTFLSEYLSPDYTILVERDNLSPGHVGDCIHLADLKLASIPPEP